MGARASARRPLLSTRQRGLASRSVEAIGEHLMTHKMTAHEITRTTTYPT